MAKADYPPDARFDNSLPSTNNNIDLVDKLVDIHVLEKFPINTVWSMGESYDANEITRSAYKLGILKGMQIMNDINSLK